MNIFFQKILLIVFFATAIPTSVCCMERQTHFPLKHLNRAHSALTWALSAGPFWALAGTFLIDKVVPLPIFKLPPACPEAQAFIHKELASYGVANAEHITIGCLPSFGLNASTAREHNLAITCGMDFTISRFDKAQKTRKYWFWKPTIDPALEQDIQEVKAVLSHEAQHIINHDSKYGLATCFAVPLGTFFLLKQAHHLVRGAFTKSPSPTFKGQSKALISTVGKGLVGFLLNASIITAYVRYREQKADDGMPNNTALLKAALRFHKEAHSFNRQRVEKLGGSRMIEFFDKYPSLYTLLDPLHPSSCARAQKFQEHLDKLEKH